MPTRDGNLNLSEYLHGKAAAESRTMGRIVERSIREGESLDRTSKLLVDMVERDAAGAAKIAENKEFPKLVKQLKKAGAELAEGGGSEVEWYRIQDRLEKYTGNLRRGGRVHKAYVELLQDVEKRGPGYVDQAAEKWLYQWQRYAADRIGNTEAQHAYRSRQYEQEKGRPWITEYTWMMNPALHAQFAKYKKVPKKGKSKGHRCDCEIYDGETVSADWVRARPMGLHPF